jgi:hypothetical protein
MNIEKRLDKIEKVLLRNTLSLEQHMKRTEILEEEVKALKKVDTQRASVVQFIDSAFKVVATFLGALVAISKLWKDGF